MLKEHIRSITYVVKLLSKDIAELQREFDERSGKVGVTHQQQEIINTRIKEQVAGVMGEQQKMQAAMSNDIKNLSSRLDNVIAKVCHSLILIVTGDSDPIVIPM